MGLEPQLSEVSREIGVVAGHRLHAPTMLFLNTHPSEHDGQGLVASLEKLSTLKPTVQIVLELHEGAITDLGQMRELRSELRRLDIRLAFDDFGAGQSRLVELAEIAPDFVKFDIGLIRGIHESAPRQQLVGGILKLCSELGIVSLAEGIEEEAEAQACRDLGFHLAQGYYYGRPAKLENWLGS
jgi:EAL domain-containing protein (putative c-di-GMP-specific phosphodiesterase class I)